MLPLVEELDIEISPQQLASIRDLYDSDPNEQNKFNYAWALLRSTSRANQAASLALFKEIYRENHARRKECIYFCALAEFKLGNYTNARQHCQSLLQLEPNNSQAIDLEHAINEKVQNEGLIGMALVGGAAALAVGIVASIFAKKK